METQNPSTLTLVSNPYFTALTAWWVDFKTQEDVTTATVLKYLRESFSDLDLETANDWLEWFAENVSTILEYVIDTEHWNEEDGDEPIEVCVQDYFSQSELENINLQLRGDIPVRLGDTGLYALFVTGDGLLENISVTQKQLVQSRGLDKALSMPAPHLVEKDMTLLEPYMTQVKEIQRTSGGKLPERDRKSIEEKGGGWMYKADLEQTKCTISEAYETLYNAWQEPLRTMQVELYLACTLGSTVLFNADGSRPKGIVGPFRVASHEGLASLDVVSPIDALKGLVNEPEPKLTGKQKSIMRQMGVDVKVNRVVTRTVEQRILWAINFIVAFPKFMDHFSIAIKNWSESVGGDDDSDAERWLPAILQEVTYPALDDTFLY